jgi:hypothetical protein
MGSLCHKEDKNKIVAWAKQHESKNKIEVDSASKGKLPKLRVGETGSQADSTYILNTEILGGLAQKLRTPQESKQIDAYIKMQDQQSELHGYKKSRSELDGGMLSARSQNKSKLNSNFAFTNDFFTTEDPIYKNDCLEILQCFNRTTGKLYTLKVVTVHIL